jgi:hypothetical protein
MATKGNSRESRTASLPISQRPSEPEVLTHRIEDESQGHLVRNLVPARQVGNGANFKLVRGKERKMTFLSLRIHKFILFILETRRC